MKTYSKTFRFTETEINMLEEIRIAETLKKDVDVIRRCITLQYNIVKGISKNTPIVSAVSKYTAIIKGVEVEVDEYGFPLDVPTPKPAPIGAKYEGYDIMINPLGKKEPYLGDFAQKKVLVIKQTKFPFKEVILEEGTEDYNLFVQ